MTISTGVHTLHESEHLRSRIVEFLAKKIREIRFDEARSRKPGFATPTRISGVQRPWWMVVVDTFVYFFTIITLPGIGFQAGFNRPVMKLLGHLSLNKKVQDAMLWDDKSLKKLRSYDS